MFKSWKKVPIAGKLFICTAAMFSVVILLLFVGQIFFYEKYYYFVLENDLKKTVSEFAPQYSRLGSDDEINKYITETAASNDAFIFILGSHGNILHMSSYDMYVKSSEKTYHVMLDNAIRDDKFFDLAITDNTKIKITYMQGRRTPPENDIIIPSTIEYGGKSWTYKSKFPTAPDSESKSIEGVILSLSLPSNAASRLSIQKNEAFEAIMSRLGDGSYIPENGEYKKYYYTNDENDSKYCIISYACPKQGEYVLAIKPLHSVSEAVYVMKDIVALWFVGVLVIAFIISILFSRIVTRPIIKITDATKQIKKLDFSKKCIVYSHDEIGILAENINDMSEKLNLTINQLVKANEELQHDIEHERILEKQRKEFVAVISHELKTPLAIIRAYSEGLIDGVAHQEKYLRVIIDETAKMDALILDMLEDSKLEIGAQHVDLRECDLADFAEKVLKKFREVCKSKNITLTENISDTPIIRIFDRDLLEQVVSNFMLNAIRYAENGAITVTVNEEIFSVENDGEHIAEDELDKIWDKFYCIGNSTHHFTGGTGLGLSIARNILALHNADFGVKNTASGVMFWFSL